jgi:hypothetical protein
MVDAHIQCEIIQPKASKFHCYYFYQHELHKQSPRCHWTYLGIVPMTLQILVAHSAQKKLRIWTEQFCSWYWWHWKSLIRFVSTYCRGIQRSHIWTFCYSLVLKSTNDNPSNFPWILSR